MSYVYFNQRQYPNVPYPHANRPGATVKTSGCGVCCAAMAIANLTDHVKDIPDMAQYSVAHGARDGYGTNLYTLLSALKSDYPGFDYRVTNNLDELLAHLKSGGAAIANVGGDRDGRKGIFCDSGHFVYVAGLNGNFTIVLDPDQYDGKYQINGRQAHVTVNGNELYCNPIRLDEDCANRDPRYYLVAGVKSNKTEPTPAPAENNYKIGDHVIFSTCYTSSDAPIESNIPASKMARNHGVITRIIPGTNNPYLLDNGLCWVNDGDIRAHYSGTRTGTVATQKKNLNVRASASTDGKILGSLKKGTPVEILDESGGWYEVRANGLTGWCAGVYIK